MKKQERIFLLVLVLVLLSCSSWMFFATTPLESNLSGLTHEFLADFLEVLQPGEQNTSSVSESIQTNSSALPKAQEPNIFAGVYVVSLPHRIDRRIGMDRLRQVVGMNWTYFDAVTADSPPVHAIIEQAISSRAARSTNPWYPAEFSWPDSLLLPDVLDTHKTSRPLDNYSSASISSSILSREVWRDPALDGQQSSASTPLTCATGNKTSGPPYDQTLPPYLVLSPPKIACWYSHAQVLQQILEGSESDDESKDDDAYLILEDDVDVERDLYQRLQEVWKVLPADWDLVFLGHCWSNESYWPALNSSPMGGTSSKTALHPSHAPKCTHAYAVSRRGAARLLSHLYYPPFAYSRALDQAYSWLIQTGRLNSYSIVPSIVVQRKILSSDVDPGERGVGSTWKERLRGSDVPGPEKWGGATSLLSYGWDFRVGGIAQLCERILSRILDVVGSFINEFRPDNHKYGSHELTCLLYTYAPSQDLSSDLCPWLLLWNGASTCEVQMGQGQLGALRNTSRQSMRGYPECSMTHIIIWKDYKGYPDKDAETSQFD
ncbi:hypothetical protein BC629DRAFT_1438095 [Irpex lacteus]|nr:hypothetical protein BC629DRAFT_1438095 [Irpex lacteus]